MDEKALGGRIAALRKEKGYSQEYVAEQVGVSRQAVSKWEQDQSAPDTYNLITLAELFGVTVDFLATGQSPSPVPSPVPTEENRPRNAEMPTRRVVGYILLGCGIVGLLIGLVLSLVVAAVGLLLTLGGILCLTVRKHLALVLIWTYWGIGLLGLGSLTGISLLAVFHPGAYASGISLRLLVGWGFWVVTFSVALLSVWLTRRHRSSRSK